MTGGMTTRELLTAASQSAFIGPALFGPAIAAGVLALVSGRNGGKAPWRYLYSAVVYAACVPGIFSAVLIAYMVGFARENVLDAPVATTIGPLFAMVVTLGLVSRRVNFRDLPGVDRLWGLMLTLAMTCVFGLLIARTHFMVIFRGSFWHLVVLCLGVFAAMQYGFHLMFRRKDEPAGF